MSIFDKTETDEDRLQRLLTNPSTACGSDVVWLAARVQFLQGAVVRGTEALKNALKADGRFHGLREAAEILEAGAAKSVRIRTTIHGVIGKRDQVQRAVNEKLLLNMANLVRQYAADAESGRLDKMLEEHAKRQTGGGSGDAPAPVGP